jgi:hypothetical protein
MLRWLQGFVKHFNLPSFLIDCRDRVAVACPITASQIQLSHAVVFVVKDLPNSKDLISIAF